MSNGKDSGSIIPISGIIALLAVIGFTLFPQIPLKGTRPYSAEIQHEPYDKVIARLWQDPFDAVLKHLELLKKCDSESTYLMDQTGTDQCGKEKNGEKDPQDSQSKLKNEIEKKINNNGEVTVLGVMVPGTEYAEDKENRMRQRYAVLSGLRSRQFLPEDSEHINFVFLTSANKQKNKQHLLTEIMPYEWFTHKSGNKKYVLLVWLNEKTFRNNPLSQLSCLITRLSIEAKNFKIIGPWESQTLKNMLSELKNDKINKEDNPIKKLKGLRIYSAFATADASGLIEEYTATGNGDAEIRKIFNYKDIIFSRIIGSDKALAEKIVKELGNRRVAFNDKENTIILVSESDSLYAGSLHDVFHHELSKQINKTAKTEKNKGANLVCISYLRGIDGFLPGEKESKADKNEDGNKQNNKSGFDLDKLAKPAGTSQYDYLRRQADDIYHNLQRRHRKVSAIGMLGSDFHDKYLVLQAFHQRFPQAIYFTTDLDAMWIHPANLQWTRNLLVASYFDLTAHNDLEDANQESIPSFRDSYQTSAFTAIRQAFPDKQQNDRQCIPKLFEIGNKRAVNLLEAKNTTNYGCTLRAIAVMAFLVLLILFYANSNVNQAVMWIFKCRKNFIIIIFTTAFVILLIYLFNIYIKPYFSNNPWEEHFSLFDGISVWPSNMLRILAFILSVCFLYFSDRSLENNRKEIENKFCFNTQEKEKHDKREKTKGKIIRYLKRAVSYNFLKEYKDTNIAELWYEYKTRNKWKYRIVWVAISFIIYFISCRFILEAFGFPSSPVRGDYSYRITYIILMAAIISFSWLFLYVFDLTRLCHQFIVNATENKPIWPPASIKECSYGIYENICHLPDNKQVQEKREKILEEQKIFLSEWMLVNIVAKRTKAVGKLIFYPLISWVVIYIARHSYFDDWNTTIGLTVIMTGSVAITWMCALMQRYDAENLRKASVSRLKEQQMRIIFSKELEDLKSQIELVIKEIQAIREGAFSPFFQHPVFRSVLLALSSVGGTYIMEYTNIFNF
ncbi:MAG: hypothetical protein KKC46_07200 [Proteobacteria bacterium]|nr:hypothetical protein [Pseudomonadota bacterium]